MSPGLLSLLLQFSLVLQCVHCTCLTVAHLLHFLLFPFATFDWPLREHYLMHWHNACRTNTMQSVCHINANTCAATHPLRKISFCVLWEGKEIIYFYVIHTEFSVRFGPAKSSVTGLIARCWQDVFLQTALGWPADNVCVMVWPHFAFLCIISLHAWGETSPCVITHKSPTTDSRVAVFVRVRSFFFVCSSKT